jgi:hypothetical protein
MDAAELPVAVWSGEFKVGDVVMRCHVLSDGRRVIDSESVHEFFSRAAAEAAAGRMVDGMSDFVRWLKGGG